MRRKPWEFTRRLYALRGVNFTSVPSFVQVRYMFNKKLGWIRARILMRHIAFKAPSDFGAQVQLPWTSVQFQQHHHTKVLED